MAKQVADPVNDPNITPIELCAKGVAGMNLCREKSYVLFSGPRKSSKTITALVCLCDHAWNTPHGNIALISISQSAGLGSGVWDQLVKGVFPKYMKLGQGMKWKKEPYTEQSSKRPTCIVTNRYGGECEFRLESLKDETEVEERFKNKEYTAMFVTELSNFTIPKTFSIWRLALRSIHGLKPEQFLFLGDTNPTDEGEDSWIYKQWMVRPKQTYAEYCETQSELDLPIPSEEDFRLVNTRLGLLEYEIADNWFLTDQDVRELVDAYSHDQDLYDRYILGKWVKASRGALFASQFRENIHVVGELETPGNPDPEILVPNDSTWKLDLTMDPGSSANSAGYIFEKVVCQSKPGGPMLPCFNILEGVSIIGQDHTLEDFTYQTCEAMFWWEQRMGRVFDWVYWSDSNIWSLKDQSTKKLYPQLIFEASARYWQKKFEETKIPNYATRTIALQAADKGKGTVEQKVDLMRKLLFEERVRISRGRCPRLVQSLKALPPSKHNPNVPPKGHSLKHDFDAVMYGIVAECHEEARASMIHTLRNRTAQGRLISIRA